MTNTAYPDQLASEETNWSGSTLFAKIGQAVFSKRSVKTKLRNMQMSHNVCKHTFGHVRPANNYISLRNRADWPEFSLSARRNSAFLAIQNAPTVGSNQNLCCANMSEGTFSDVDANAAKGLHRGWG